MIGCRECFFKFCSVTNCVIKELSEDGSCDTRIYMYSNADFLSVDLLHTVHVLVDLRGCRSGLDG